MVRHSPVHLTPVASDIARAYTQDPPDIGSEIGQCMWPGGPGSGSGSGLGLGLGWFFSSLFFFFHPTYFLMKPIYHHDSVCTYVKPNYALTSERTYKYLSGLVSRRRRA